MADLGAGAIFGAINTAFKFSEFVIALNEVGTENHVFVRTIQRVREDLEETERLLCLPVIRSNLLSNPEKSLWIKKAIYSTKCALNDIGLYVERVRSEHDRDGDISFKNRVRWVLNDHGKLENRRSELTACHQTLTTVLNSLHHIEMIAGFAAPAPPSDPPPPTYGAALAFEDFKSPYQRKKNKGKTPLVAVTETTEVYNAAGKKSHFNMYTTNRTNGLLLTVAAQFQYRRSQSRLPNNGRFPRKNQKSTFPRTPARMNLLYVQVNRMSSH